ncbi:MAG TPA: hypothetical protein VF609_13265 [Flavisolibacter sp.]|jgi:hypothetical protein
MAVPPVNSDFTSFAIHCWKQGIKVQSRYQGVYCKRAVKMYKGRVASFTILWCAKYERDGIRFVKHFPFTKQGEINAHNAYEEFLDKNNLQKQYQVRRGLQSQQLKRNFL